MLRNVLFIMFFFPATLHAATFTWNGSASSDWNTAANWTPSFVPAAPDHVIIVSTANVPVLDAERTVTNFTISGGTLNLSGFTLHITGDALASGGAVNNGLLDFSGNSINFVGTSFGAAINASCAEIRFNGSLFNAAVNATQTGSAATGSSGGNTFNGVTTITNTGDGSMVLADGSPDLYNNDVTFNTTGNGLILVSYNSTGNTFGGTATFNNSSAVRISVSQQGGSTLFNGNVIISSTDGQGVHLGSANGTVTLSPGNTITIGTAGFSAGELRFQRFTQSGSTAQNLTLTANASLGTYSNSQFNGTINFTAPKFTINETTFNANLTIEQTGAIVSSSAGGNVFNGITTITNSGDATFFMADYFADTYNNDVTYNASAGATFIIGFNTMNNTFAGTATFNNTGTGNIFVSMGGSSVFNGNIVVNSQNGMGIQFGSGTGSATLATGKTITTGLTGFSSGTLTLNAFTQNGTTPQNLTLTGTARLVLSANSSFAANVNFTSPGIVLDGCTFYGTATIEKTGTGNDVSSGGNIFNGITNIRNSGSGYLLMGGFAPDIFNNDVTFENTGSNSIFVAYDSQSNIFNGTTTINNTTPESIYISSLGSAIFNGNLVMNNTSTGLIRFGINGGSNSFAGNITVNNSTSQLFEGAVMFTGNNAQQFTSTAPSNSFNTITMNKPSGALTLNAPVTVNSSLIFTSGKIITTQINFLKINDDATVSGAGTNSFVEGPVAKQGDDAFTFPTGKAANYQPITITAPQSAGDIFTAEYFNSEQTLGTGKDASLQQISTCEYWNLDRTAGTSAVSVTLGWNPNSCNITQPSDMRVAGWDGAKWADHGNGASTGDQTTGTVTSASTVNGFGEFTVGNVTSMLQIPCYADEVLNELLEENTQLQGKLDSLNFSLKSFIEEILRNPDPNSQINVHQGTYIIPVVIYIIHNGGTENISDAQIQSQITALNDRFRVYGIQFCLATRNITNNTAFGGSLPGVFRIQNAALTDFDILTEEAALKTVAAIPVLPVENYLRIWVVRSITDGNVTGILGQAHFPGSAPLGRDGIVMASIIFGGNNFAGLPANSSDGEGLVHEVGHYLNLYHTFQGGCTGSTAGTCATGGDWVCDTPGEIIAHTNCSTVVNSCTDPVPDPVDPLDNYMGYTQDPCKNNFTNGQEERMIASILLFRNMLVSSQNLINTGVACTGGIFAQFGFNIANPCTGDQITFAAVPGGATFDWDFGDGVTISGNPVIHVYQNPGIYNVTLTVDNTVSQVRQVFVSNCLPIQSTQGNWYFGRFAGLDFRTGRPLPDIAAFLANPRTTNGNEGVITESDANGDLLFYGGGQGTFADYFIYNRNHQRMSNISIGHPSGTQATISVPEPPGNTGRYYIFSVSADEVNLGFHFSIVDMNLGVNGQLTNENTPILGPINALRNLTDNAVIINEQITAVPNCNGDGFWIIVKGNYRDPVFNRAYFVYPLTAIGIGPPQIFDFPALPVLEHVGQMKASPDGNKLAHVTLSLLAVYDFDKTNGAISNPRVIANRNFYGCSFSPNSRILYSSIRPPTQQWRGIYQYDLTVADIAGSARTAAVTFAPNDLYAMQLGPDNKLYIAIPGRNQLAVINFPDNINTLNNLNACGFNLNGPVLFANPNDPAQVNTIRAGFGLPNMIDARPSPPQPPATFSFTIINCNTVNFEAPPCAINYIWDFGDNSPNSNFQNPIHTYVNNGTYTVTLRMNGNIIAVQNITIGINPPIIAGPVCITANMLVNYSTNVIPGFIYDWAIIGGNPQTVQNRNNIDVMWNSGGGTIQLTATDPRTGCQAISVLNVFAIEPILINFPTVTPTCSTICSGRVSALPSGGLSPYTFRWSDPSSQPGSLATGLCMGTYTVTVTDNSGCNTSTGTVTINTSPAINASISGDLVYCSGTSTTLTAITTGGTSPYTYSWLTSPVQTTPNIIVNTNGVYTVTVTDFSGCSVTATVLATSKICCPVPPGATEIPSAGATFGTGTTISGVVVVNGNITITGDVTINSPDMRFAQNTGIIINSGTLKITSAAKLYGCTFMWNGITVNGGASLVIDGNSTVEDALIGIESVNGGDIQLNNANLNKNLKHIVVQQTAAHPAQIQDTRFTCENDPGFSPGTGLKAPHAGKRTQTGIEINSVSSIDIGVQGGVVNLFDNMDFGIRSQATSMTVVLNNFTNLLPPSSGNCPANCPFVGVAIWSQNTGAIRTIAVAVNTFTNINEGVRVETDQDVFVTNNRFDNFITGVFISNCKSRTIRVEKNRLANFSLRGIHCIDNAGGNMRISENTLDKCRGGRGIIAEEPNQITMNVNILKNTLTNILKGITAVKIFDGLNVSDNSITNIANVPSPAYRAYGISVSGSGYCNIERNTISPDKQAKTNQLDKIQGIILTLSEGSDVKENKISNMGSGMRFVSNNGTSVITCNIMTNCRRGVVLDGTTIGNQGTISSPSDNQWVDANGFTPLFDLFELPGTLGHTWFVRAGGIFDPFPIAKNNTIIDNTANGIGPCPPPPPCGPICIQAQLADELQSVNNYQSLVEENKFFIRDAVWRQLNDNPSLMNQGTGNDHVLRSFYDSASAIPLGRLARVNEHINNRNFTQAIAESAGINPAILVENNHRIVYDLYLEAVMNGYVFSENQITRLRAIANQCPQMGGKAVFGARVLLNFALNTIIDYEDDNCTQSSSKTVQGNKKDTNEKIRNGLKFKLYPNPNSGTFQIEYELEETSTGYLIIYDVMSREIARLDLNKDKEKLNTTTLLLQDGIYYYRVIVDGAVIMNDKLSVIK